MGRRFAPAVLLMIPLLAACNRPSGQQAGTGDLKFITIVKSTGFNWFRRMETGVRQFAHDTGIQTLQQGPSKADAALQVQVIEDAIAQRPKALLVVPFQVETVEPVLRKARDQGIIVVTHEASNIRAESAAYDVEAFDNAAYGRHIMDELASGMGGEGNYVVFIGSLTSKSHNEWVDAAVAHQKENYPKMQLVGTRNETSDDPQKVYQIMKDLLRTYPGIRGVQGSAATDVVGAAQAIQDAGLSGKITVVGTSLPSNAVAAQFSGIDNPGVTLRAHMISGLLSAIAGLVSVARTNSANAEYGSSYLLMAILVAVLGGISVNGGHGHLAGVALALLSLQMLSTGFNMLLSRYSGSNFFRDFAWGFLLLFVMVFARIDIGPMQPGRFFRQRSGGQ